MCFIMETVQECQESFTDVVELCALLQCLGFSIKSLDTSSEETTQDEGQQVRNVVLHCQTSGLHVVMEKTGMQCSCPVNSQHNSGIWQVSAVSQGKVMDKEIGSSILGSLPKNYKEKLSKGLQELMKNIKSHNESIHVDKTDMNKSTSTSRTAITPEPENKKNYLSARLASPARYRSLDTLTNTRNMDEDVLPPPGALMKKTVAESVEYMGDSCEDVKERVAMQRQSTYSLDTPKPDKKKSNVHRNKTSSPIQSSTNIYDSLLEAKRKAEELNELIGMLIRGSDEGKTSTSMSSLALNVSDISLLKAPEKQQFASSPNLSDYIQPKTHLKMFENAQGLRDPKSIEPNSKMSKLRRLSPSNFFKPKKDSKLTVPMQRCQSYSTGKLSGQIKPRIVTPVRIPISTMSRTPEPSPRLNSSKNKYSHIKSTIPKPSPSFRKKE